MVDTRFFEKKGPFSLQQVADLTGAVLHHADLAQKHVNDVAPLDRATQDEISFLDNTKYIDVFKGASAGACFVREKFVNSAPPDTALLICDEPYRCYALIAQAFYPRRLPTPEISKHAYLHQSTKIGKDCHIGPNVVSGLNVMIGNHCEIGPNVVIGDGVTIGDECQIGANCTITHALIGDRVILHRGVHIGQDGFGFAMNREGHVKVPQLGRVIIEDDVEIGAGTCIDRGAGPDTLIGQGSKIDNLVQIGHNAHIGKGVIIVAQTGIAGSTRIGDGAVLGGQVGISGHLKIGPGVRVAAQSGVIGDLPAGTSWGGTPAVPIKDWHRQSIALSKLIRKKEETT